MKTDFEIGDSGCHDFYGQAVVGSSVARQNFNPPVY